MSKLLFGTFYTKETSYEQVVNEYLIPSCKKAGIEPIVEGIPNKGTWTKNVAEKPRIILSLLESFIREDDILVFVDADATIERYPIELCNIPSEYEIGYHTLDWNSWYGYTSQKPVHEVLSGTMIFRNTENVRHLCAEWYKEAKSSNLWEQKVLQGLLKQNGHLKVYDLPVEYCFMTSLPDGRKPLVKCKPIIKHYQKSRELKRTL